MRYVLIIILSFIFGSLSAQRPDSVQIDGEWRFVYPIDELLSPSEIYLQKTGLLHAEFDLWRKWKIAADSRTLLKDNELHKALETELVATKVLTAERYQELRENQPGFISRLRYRNYSCTKAHAQGRTMDYGYQIDPVLYDLPDGLYVQYFQPFYTPEKPDKATELPIRVACLFAIKDNLLEGSFERWDETGVVVTKGKLKNGEREGPWLMSESLVYGREVDDHFVANELVFEWMEADFSEGLLHGNYRLLDNDHKLIESGQFDKGHATGEWYLLRTSAFETYIQPDLPIKASLTYLPVNDSIPIRNIWRAEMLGNYSSKILPKPDLPFLSMSNARHLSSLVYTPLVRQSTAVGRWLFEDSWANDWYKLSRKDSLAEPFFYGRVSSVEANWKSNGRLAWRFRYDSLAQCMLGAQYYENGTLADTIGVDPFTGQLCRRVYEEKGALVNERYLDAQGNLTENVYKETGELWWTIRYDYKGAFIIDSGEIQLSGLDDMKMQMKTIDGFSAMRMVTAEKDESTLWTAFLPALTNAGCTEINWEPVKLRKVSATFSDASDELLHEFLYDKRGKAILERRFERMDDSNFVEIGRKEWIVVDGVTAEKIFYSADEANVRLVVGEKPLSGNLTVNSGDGRSEIRRDSKTGTEVSVNYEAHERSRKRREYVGRYVVEDEGAYELYEAIQGFLGGGVRLWGFTKAYGKVENGSPVGTWHFLKSGKELFTLEYKNGVPTGTVVRTQPYHRQPDYVSYEMDLVDGVAHGKMTRYDYPGYESSVRYYTHGNLDGRQIRRSNSHQVTAFYKDGIRSGVFSYVQYETEKLEDGLISKKSDTIFSCVFENDTLNGPVNRAAEDNYRLRASYKRGVVDGLFEITQYNQNRLRIQVKMGEKMSMEDYSNGVLSGSYRFFPGDTAKVRLNFVGDLLKDAEIRSNSPMHKASAYLVPYVDTYLSDSAYFTKHYPNGQASRQGKLVKTDYRTFTKKGLWNYFSYDGLLLYTIDFKDSMIHVGDKQLAVKGIYTEFDGVGKIVSREYVINEQEQYNCSQEEYYAIREYLTLPESPGRQNGLAKHYFDNGMLMSEGQVENGLPVGVWKFYTPDGKLTMVGKYKNGLKDGRWLSGDLSDKAYIGDICLDPDAADLDVRIAQLERDHSITVTIYHDAKASTSQDYEMRK